MSVRLMSLIWATPMGSTDKLVMLALADWSNDDGVCWPSMKQLADKSGLTDRSVRASVARMVVAGHLSRVEKVGKGVVYTVHPGTSFPPEAASPRKETTKTPEARSANTPRTTIPTSEAKASSVAAREPKPRATKRCPVDWSPSPADIETVAGLGFSPGEIERELATIRDCEFGTPRSDWSATFRNWFRRESKSRKPQNVRPDKLNARHENYADSWTGAERAVALVASRRGFGPQSH